MNSKDLTHQQFGAISKGLYPGSNYLARLKNRMDQQAFPPNDPLFMLVINAVEAMHRLNVHVHYQSCRGGVG